MLTVRGAIRSGFTKDGLVGAVTFMGATHIRMYTLPDSLAVAA
jgi:hypothetical protein